MEACVSFGFASGALELAKFGVPINSDGLEHSRFVERHRLCHYLRWLEMCPLRIRDPRRRGGSADGPQPSSAGRELTAADDMNRLPGDRTRQHVKDVCRKIPRHLGYVMLSS